ncbi:MAG: hypothetical protein ABI182_09165, partial [Candidatus Baltobacteraceae bacterium]
MQRRFRSIAAVLAVVLSLGSVEPSRAASSPQIGINAIAERTLSIPLTGQRVRPITASSLFHTLFVDFFTEPDRTTYVQTGD